MKNTRLDEAQAGIKIAGRNINNLRYADDTTLMVESEEELKSLLMKVKDSTQGLRPQHRRGRNPERPPSNSHGASPLVLELACFQFFTIIASVQPCR